MKSPTLPALGNFIEWNSLIAAGDLSHVQAMLEKGELSSKDKLGKYQLSPLHLAAWHNQPEICQFLISQKISPAVRETFSGKTPLHIAAYFGHLEAAEVFTNFETKVAGRKARDFLGCLPLHYAALGEKEKMLFFLMGRGHKPSESFSVRTLSSLGNTLDVLIRRGNYDLCDKVSSYEGISIVETNPIVGTTIYIGYDNENPWTPFHSAAALGEKDILQMLLRKFPHAYCFRKEFAGFFDYSPGEVALLEGHTEVARMLGEAGTIENCRKAFGRFHIAKKAHSHARNLLKAILEKDFPSMDRLLEEHGESILFQPNFNTDLGGIYMRSWGLNAFSVISRLFYVSFAQWLKEKKIEISPQEFLERDRKELVFFNWAMVDIHPYATGFFAQVSEEIDSLQS